MEELKQILLIHVARYPQMEPTDAVKLIYQNEFGGGHLIRDTASCLEYLHREYVQTKKDREVLPYEEIGNGLLRVNLAALPAQEITKLGESFILSAAVHTGNTGTFRTKLQLLRSVCTEGVFSFDLPELDAYLSEYEKAGFPMVSHSPEYRAAYRPAYRIVRKDIYFGDGK